MLLLLRLLFHNSLLFDRALIEILLFMIKEKEGKGSSDAVKVKYYLSQKLYLWKTKLKLEPGCSIYRILDVLNWVLKLNDGRISWKEKRGIRIKYLVALVFFPLILPVYWKICRTIIYGEFIIAIHSLFTKTRHLY